MKKRILSLIMCVAIMVTLLPQTVLTASALAGGTVNKKIIWVLDDEGTLTVSGSGAIDGYGDLYKEKTPPWENVKGNIKKVVIKTGITEVGARAFQGCPMLTDIVICEGVTEISHGSFAECPRLKTVTLARSISSSRGKINDQAFYKSSSSFIINCYEDDCSEAFYYSVMNDIELNYITDDDVFNVQEKAETTPSILNFTKVNTYLSDKFVDVPQTAWYAGSVKKSYELNLVKGGANRKFSPDGNMTIAEALALAARIHRIYNTGKADFTQGEPWYDVYISYAITNGILTAKSDFADYTKPINRAQFATIFSKVLPNSELNSINNITAIPDVSSSLSFSNNVYKLYNAGIITGSDKYGTFNPYTNIKRSEVATIATRIVDKSLRKTFVIEKRPAIQGVKVNGSSTIYVGQKVKYTATVTPEGAVPNVSWASGNPGVATVDQAGNVTALKPGQSNITATAANGMKNTLLVTVAYATPTTVTLAGKTSIEVRTSTKWTATVAPASANQWVSWSSGNPGVATVDKTGTIVGVKPGKANITATAVNGVKKTVTVTVTPSLSEQYKSLARTDMTRIRSKYSTAKGTNAYVYAYTNSYDQLCILVTIQYRIINVHTETFLHIIPTGQVIENPSTYYKILADTSRSYETKSVYLNLRQDVAGAELTSSAALVKIIAEGINPYTGAYANAAYLNN